MNSIIFPGQGSQYVEMGKNWYENYKEAKDIFDEADKILNESLSDLIFKGPDDFWNKNRKPYLRKEFKKKIEV